MKGYGKGHKFSLFMLFVTIASVLAAAIIFIDIIYAPAVDTAFAASVDNEVESIVLTEDEIECEFDCYFRQLDRSQAIHNDIEDWLDMMSLKVCTEKEAQRAQKIADNTPLDLETSITVVDYADKFDLDVSLILGVIDLESDFKQYEVGAAQDRGYMQIIPSTEKWLFKEYGNLLSFDYNPKNIFDPEYNIGVGCLYLHELKSKHGDNEHRILSEYNRGPYNLKRYYDKHGTYETSYSKTVRARARKYTDYNQM